MIRDAKPTPIPLEEPEEVQPAYPAEDEVEPIEPPVTMDDLPKIEETPAVVVIQPLPSQPRTIGGRIITAPPPAKQGIYRQPGLTGGHIITG